MDIPRPSRCLGAENAKNINNELMSHASAQGNAFQSFLSVDGLNAILQAECIGSINKRGIENAIFMDKKWYLGLWCRSSRAVREYHVI
jgi:hypothetical protein